MSFNSSASNTNLDKHITHVLLQHAWHQIQNWTSISSMICCSMSSIRLASTTKVDKHIKRVLLQYFFHPLGILCKTEQPYAASHACTPSAWHPSKNKASSSSKSCGCMSTTRLASLQKQS